MALPLPRFIVLKSDEENKYLGYIREDGESNGYLCLMETKAVSPYTKFEVEISSRNDLVHFATNDIGDSTVACEISVTHDENVCIKPTYSDRFWRHSLNWIWADSNESRSNNKDTLFRSVKFDNQTIGLLNLGNNYFCKRFTIEGKTSYLNASIPSITKKAQLRVEELVLTRTIYNVKYNLDDSRIYNEATLILARNSASNYTREPFALDVKLSYTNSKIRT
ncbi:hypothetical protein REPUB_Repub16aG0140100 [Reevesia pubescens]